MIKIYTKQGDKGMTSILGGKRVSKSCLEMEAIGEVDELNANLGLLIAELNQPEIASSADANWLPRNDIINKLIEIQSNLFVIGANLAALQSPDIKTYKLTDLQTYKLEEWIDAMESELPELKNFILPGGDLAAAQSYLARVVCRRAERVLIKLSETYSVDPLIKQYLNRLSDYLFVLGRWINFKNGIEEIKWKK